MPANTTNAPNTDHYSLGRGRVYFADLVNGLPGPGGWEFLGNCPQFNSNMTVETLEHVSSISGTANVDKRVPISQELSVSFQLDEINHQNLARFLQGNQEAGPTNPAVAGFAAVVISSAVVLGRWYDIVDSNGVRAYDIASANVTVTEPGTPTNLVEGTDYELDEKWGRIRILPTAVNIAAGESFDVALAADAGAVATQFVKGMTQTNIAGALKFIQLNPADNDRETEYEFHQVRLTPDGDFALIGNEFQVLGFTAVIERNDAKAAARGGSPFVDIVDHANA